MRTRLWTLIALLAVAAAARPAAAQTSGSWNVDADGNYGTAGNWLNNVIPDGGGVATFGGLFGLTGDRTVTVDISPTLSGLTFDTSFTYTLGGAGPITTTGAFTINAVSSDGSTPSSFGAGHVITTVLAGNGGLTKTGVGTVTLGGTNTFTGGVQVNQGELRITTGDAALGNAANGLTLNGGILRVSTTALTAPATRTLTIGAGGGEIRTFAAATFAGPVVGAGTLTKSIGGALTLTGDASGFTGGLNVHGGSITLGGAAAVGGAGAVDLAGAVVLDNTATNNNDRIARGFLSRGGQVAVSGNVAGTAEVAGALTLETGWTVVTVAPAAGAAASIEFAGLTRNNRAAGFLRGTNLGTAGAANVLFTAAPAGAVGGGGDPLTTTTASIIPYLTAGTAADTVTGTTFAAYDAATRRIVPLPVAGGYATDITAAGPTDNVNQNASATLPAATTVNSLRLAPGANITIGGGQLTLTSGAVLHTSATATVQTTLAAGVAAAAGQELVIHAASGGSTTSGLRISGVISGTGGLTATGPGVLTIANAANTYTGPTNLQGTLLLTAGTVTNNGTPGLLGQDTSAIVMGSGSTTTNLVYALGGPVVINRDIQIVGGGSVAVALGTTGGSTAESLTINGNISVSNPTGSLANGFVSFEGGATLAEAVTVNGVISGSGGVTDSFGPFTVLNGANTYTGGTDMLGGTYVLGNDAALGTGRVTVSAASTIQAGGGPRFIGNPVSVFANALTFTGANALTLSGEIDLAGGPSVLTTGDAANATAVTLSGPVTRGGLVKAGPGTLALINAGNTYTGSTTVRNGSLIVGGPAGATGVLGVNPQTAPTVFLGDAGTAAADNLSLLVSGPANVSRGIRVNDVASATGLATLGGTNGTGTVTFSGPIVLNRTSNATRFTAAAGGTVAFTGTISEAAAGAPVQVIGGGRVQFAAPAGNTYTGATTVVAGATLVATNSGGSATGTAPVSVAGTLAGTGFISGLVTATGTVAPGNTAVSVGDLKLNGGLTLDGGTYAVDVSGAASDRISITGALTLTGPTTLTLIGALDPAATYNLITYTAGRTGTFSTAPAPATHNLMYGPAAGAGAVQLVPVPEPATVLGLAAAGVGLARLVRRRRTV